MNTGRYAGCLAAMLALGCTAAEPVEPAGCEVGTSTSDPTGLLGEAALLTGLEAFAPDEVSWNDALTETLQHPIQVSWEPLGDVVWVVREGTGQGCEHEVEATLDLEVTFEVGASDVIGSLSTRVHATGTDLSDMHLDPHDHAVVLLSEEWEALAWGELDRHADIGVSDWRVTIQQELNDAAFDVTGFVRTSEGGWAVRPLWSGRLRTE